MCNREHQGIKNRARYMNIGLEEEMISNFPPKKAIKLNI